jgi:hypothetical protein
VLNNNHSRNVVVEGIILSLEWLETNLVKQIWWQGLPPTPNLNKKHLIVAFIQL